MSVIVTFPTVLFEDYKFGLKRLTTILRSSYTGKRQALSWPFALWTCECKLVTYTQYKDAEVNLIRAFLMDLEGQANVFRLPIVGGEKPLSNYLGAEGIVNAAGQTGKVINSSGWTANSLILKKGDYITINDELKVASQDISSNASGVATLVFKPAMKKSPPLNAVIKVRNCTVLMSAATDDIASWDVKTALQHGFSLSLIEAYE